MFNLQKTYRNRALSANEAREISNCNFRYHTREELNKIISIIEKSANNGEFRVFYALSRKEFYYAKVIRDELRKLGYSVAIEFNNYINIWWNV